MVCLQIDRIVCRHIAKLTDRFNVPEQEKIVIYAQFDRVRETLGLVANGGLQILSVITARSLMIGVE